MRLSSGIRVDMIEPSQGPLLTVNYGGSFATVQHVFVLLYVLALSLRGTLWLDAYDCL